MNAPEITIPDHAFTQEHKVLFKHCDPAGIVFFPRYIEMMNDRVEEFFDHIGHPFEQILENGGVPTAQLEASFAKPSRHGDRLQFALWLTKLGRSSASVRITAYAGDELRVQFRSVLVFVDTQGRSKAWPDDIRRALEPYLQNEED